jgi:peptidyl-prolyl cis-trans isomerase D
VITTMREYFGSLKFIILIVVVAFIVTSVVYFGTGTFDGGGARSGVVATVNGEEITHDRFRRAHANYMEFYRQAYKEKLTPEMAERLGLTRQVVDALVQEELIVQQAQREGLSVTREEVFAEIARIPQFQVDGRYSQERALEILKRVQTSQEQFVTEMGRNIQRRKIESVVRDGVKVSDEEVKQAYGFRQEKVRAEWASLDVQPLLAQITVPDADVEPYVKAHQPRFTRPERRRIQYVVVSSRSFAEPVSDTDAEAYYREHPAEFDKARRVRVAHVLVRVPPVGGSDAEQKSKAKVADVIQRAKAGEDFAKLAKDMSEDTATAAQGGDLGLVGKNEMVPQFEEAVFALKKGEITPVPVRTPFGYHAIKVMDIQDGGRSPFKEVAPRIKEKLLTERSEQAAQKRAEEVKAPLQASSDFAAEAKKQKLDLRETAFGRGDGLEGIGRDGAFEEAVFGLAVSGVSAPIKTAGGHVIAKVVEHLPAGVPPLDVIKTDAVDAIKHERAEALAAERAKALGETLAKGGDFRETARQAGFTVGDLPLFSRAAPPKERAAMPGQVLVAALQTPAGQVSAPVKTPGGVYIVKTVERQPADLSGLEAEHQELRRQVLEQKRNQALEVWLRGLRAAAKIEVTAEGPGAAR